MAPLGFVVFSCLVITCYAVTKVDQCPGQQFDNLSDNVQLPDCKNTPCSLKRKTTQHLAITFTPDKYIDVVHNHVTAEVVGFGFKIPFFGVDGTSICDKLFTESGEKADCPVKAGTKYVYKDSFPVLSYYPPKIAAKIHWALTDGENDVSCFELDAVVV